MSAPLCTLWPGAEESRGLFGALFVPVAAGLLAACLVLPVAVFVGADRRGALDLEAFVGSEPALQTVGPLAPVFVEVNLHGWAFICGKRVSPPALRELLRRTARIAPDQKVIFKINPATPTQYLGPFLDACTAAGIRRVNIIE